MKSGQALDILEKKVGGGDLEFGSLLLAVELPWTE